MRLSALVFAALAFVSLAAKDPNECEVCKSVVDRVRAKLSDKDKKDLVSIENAFGKFCDKPGNEKETKLCYYIDPIKREVSTPLKNGVPTDVICNRLKKKSAEICSLKYSSSSSSSEQITAKTDLSKLKISQLKAFMAEKSIVCNECVEKGDFVAKIKSYFEKEL